MYLWKCWRDTRAFFFIFLIMAVAIMPTAAVLTRGSDALKVAGIVAFTGTLLMILNGAALGLGAIGAIHEFSDDTVHFLFTKPRSRGYFVWNGWAVGCAEFLAVGLANLFVGWLTLSYYSPHPLSPPGFRPVRAQTFISMFVSSLLVYSLTYALTALLRNGLKGMGASLATVVGLPGLAAAIRWRWHIKVPVPVDRIGSLPMAASVVVWTCGALLLVLAAQAIIERAEI